jgi:hypothetical protein
MPQGASLQGLLLPSLPFSIEPSVFNINGGCSDQVVRRKGVWATKRKKSERQFTQTNQWGEK